MRAHRDLGVGPVIGGRDAVRPLGLLLGGVEALAITKQLETFRRWDVTVRGVKSGEVFLFRRLIMIGDINVTRGHKDAQGAGLRHRAGCMNRRGP